MTFLLYIDSMIRLSRRCMMSRMQTFVFMWYFLILCQALVTVHSLFSSGMHLVQDDFGCFDRLKLKIFLWQHRAAFFLSYGERTVAKGSACFRKFWLLFSRGGAGLSFFCTIIRRKKKKRRLRHFACISFGSC